jgi:signal transduction histidine kinase
MSTVELKPSADDSGSGLPEDQRGLGNAVLLLNARWFTGIRWIVVAAFVAVGMAGHLSPDITQQLGFVPPRTWPWILAGILCAANLVFLLMLRHLNPDSPVRATETNLWLQIAVDLVILSVLVHKVGSVDTFVAFAYLFHIALACIFFTRRHSFIVTLLASSLYMACVCLESSRVISSPSILLSSTPFTQSHPIQAMAFAASAVAVWFVVWYLVATLSGAVRTRDQQLAEANARLMKVDEEINRQVLRTAHDLKAPFSGIQSSIHVLRWKHWEDLEDPIRKVIESIQVRSQTLSERISDILLLGDLRSRTNERIVLSPVSLELVINAVVADLKDKAESRNVSIGVSLEPDSVLGEQKQLAILFSNLIANAVLYSHEGGEVNVVAERDGDSMVVSVIDHGIGIKPEAMERIFEEYYRTGEAARFNKLSTGLGLSIVKRVAGNLGITVRVTSEHGEGTRFDVTVPVAVEGV